MIIFRTGSRIRRDHLEPVTNKSHSHSTPRPSLYGIWKLIILNFCSFLAFFFSSPLSNSGGIEFFSPLYLPVWHFPFWFQLSFKTPHIIPSGGKSQGTLGYETSVYMFNLLWRGHQSLFRSQTSSHTSWISWEETVWENLGCLFICQLWKKLLSLLLPPCLWNPVVTFCG